MKLSKQQVIDLFNGLQAVSNLPGAKWSYAVARNIAKLKSEVEALQRAYTTNDKDFLEYEKQRLELAQKHAVKEKGKPKTVKIGNTTEYVVADKVAFEKELFKLQEKYKEALDKRKKQVDDFNEILKEEIEIDFYMVNPDYIPENITPAQLSAIMLIISEKENT